MQVSSNNNAPQNDELFRGTLSYRLNFRSKAEYMSTDATQLNSTQLNSTQLEFFRHVLNLKLN
jgi:hypothetical protein